MVYYSHMNTIQPQVKLNLPPPLMDVLVSRSQRFGVPITVYMKHLIMKDAENSDVPIFKATAEVDAAYEEAVKAEKAGKLIKLNFDK